MTESYKFDRRRSGCDRNRSVSPSPASRSTSDKVAAQGRVRLGAWMIIAGTLGTVLAVLTYIDVWNVSDTKPTAWAVVAALCAVLSLGGFVVLWAGLTAGAKAAAAAGRTDEQA